MVELGEREGAGDGGTQVVRAGLGSPRAVLLKLVSRDLGGGWPVRVLSMCFGVVSASYLLSF